jgi:hypothetical protein
VSTKTLLLKLSTSAVAAITLVGIANAQSPTYQGRAYAASGNISLVAVSAADTGVQNFTSAGGSKHTTLATFNLPPLLTLSTLQGTTAASAGNEGTIFSNASSAGVNLNVAGVITLTTGTIAASAVVNCTTNGPFVYGGAHVQGLNIGGVGVAVTGLPNQVITVPLGTVTINEQTRSANTSTASMTVNAIHVRLNPLGLLPIDLVLGSAFVSANCPCSGTGYHGEADVAEIEVPLVAAAVVATGPQDYSTSGGSETLSTASFNVMNILSGTLPVATITASNGTTKSQASLTFLNVNVVGVGVTADVISSSAESDCSGSGSSTSFGSSVVTNLVVNGSPITVTGNPNQIVPIPGGELVINQQIPLSDGIEVIALHVAVGTTGTTDAFLGITVAQSFCNCLRAAGIRHK